MVYSEVLGYVLATISGLIMGLIGGGGSILSVPIMVYLLGLNPITATAYSLFIVGTTSSFGAIKSLKNKLVDIKSALIFAPPSILGVFLTRRYLVPLLPDVIFSFESIQITSKVFIMLIFAIVILFASLSMLFKKNNSKIHNENNSNFNVSLIFLLGLATGVISGFVGAGGGFLNIPILVFFVGLAMKKAVGTSLFIIAIKSLIGFLGDLNTLVIDWEFLLRFTLMSIIGIILGLYLAKFIDSNKLKKGFGYFTLLMGSYIIIKELF